MALFPVDALQLIEGADVDLPNETRELR